MVNVVKLSDDPPIFVTQTNSRNRFLGDIDCVLTVALTRRCYCLVVQAFSIYKKSDQDKAERLNAYEATQRQYPNLKLIALCNEDVELSVFESSSIRSVVINQNAFVDERIFDISNEPKKYYAVYNAQLKTFKRHYLAKLLSKVALIYYGGEGDLPYYREVKAILPNAHFVNGEPRDIGGNRFRFLSQATVALIYGQSQIGLCLSDVEGAMYASVEYLLCGLPVLSTRNYGGRDVFAQNDFWLTVEATPEAVQLGCQELLKRDLSPDLIRSATLRTMQEHRERLFSVMDKIFADHHQNQRYFRLEFESIFQDKLWKKLMSPDEVLRLAKF